MGGKSGSTGKAHDYYASFAAVFGIGPATELVALIADGKTVWPRCDFWKIGKAYAASGGSLVLVIFGGRAWKCILGHTAGSSNQPPNPTYWTPYTIKRTDSGITNPYKIFDPTYGEAWVYWGTEDQVLSTSGLGPGGSVPPENTFAASHPPYRGQIIVFFKNWLCGRERTSLPNILLVMRRAPEQTVITGAAAVLDSDGQANPVAWDAEVLTHPFHGAGMQTSALNATWATEAAASYGQKGVEYIAPLIEGGSSPRQILGETALYRDAWYRWESDGKIGVGRFSHNTAPPTFTPATTIDYHDLEEEVVWDPETWADAVTDVRVRFRDQLRGFKEDAEPGRSGYAFAVVGETRIETMDRLWIQRRTQAQAFAAEASRIKAQPAGKATLVVRAGKAGSIRPGTVFLLTHDAIGLSVIMRCITKTSAAPPDQKVTIEAERERGLALLPYQPTPNPPQGPVPPDPEFPTLVQLLQAPNSLSGRDEYTLVCLAARRDPLTVELHLWMQQEDSSGFVDLHDGLTQRQWAIHGTFSQAYADNLPASGTVPPDDDSWTLQMTIHADTIRTDLEKILATQTADAISDSDLLLWGFSPSGNHFEIMAVKECQLISGDTYQFKVRRGRFATTQRAFAIGDKIWVMRRADLVFLTHDRFAAFSAAGDTASFRVQGVNAFGAADLSDPSCPTITFAFGDRFFPSVTWLATRKRSSAGSSWTDLSDYSVSYVLTDQFQIRLTLSNADGALASGALVAKSGASQVTLWASPLAGASVTLDVGPFSLEEGDWRIQAIAKDKSGRQAMLPLTDGGSEALLKVHPASVTVAAMPVATPPGRVVTGSGVTVTLTCSTSGATIHAALTAIGAAAPTSWPYSGSSGMTVAVGPGKTLHFYASKSGLANSAIGSEDYESSY